MQTKFIEATNGPHNWGKFLVGRFTDDEWLRRSEVSPPTTLLAACGWDSRHLLVVDLQTGEGGIFFPKGNARADLEKHKIWVCPLFEPFLTWLYRQNLTELNSLPALVDLPDAPFEWSGYRRGGPKGLSRG